MLQSHCCACWHTPLGLRGPCEILPNDGTACCGKWCPYSLNQLCYVASTTATPAVASSLRCVCVSCCIGSLPACVPRCRLHGALESRCADRTCNGFVLPCVDGTLMPVLWCSREQACNVIDSLCQPGPVCQPFKVCGEPCVLQPQEKKHAPTSCQCHQPTS